jgi:predicted NAD/FAD-binding protein
MASIAVVGGGLAGLSAAWRLSRRHRVTLLERHAVPGMDAHSLDFHHDGFNARIDVPLRVLYAGYYPTLMAMYRAVGVAVESTNYAGSFSRVGGDAYFRYRNALVGGTSIPLPAPPWGIPWLQIVRDLVRLRRLAPRHLRTMNDALPLGTWLEQQRFSSAFANGFLVPVFATIGTCSYQAVRAYPARVVLDYLTRGLVLGGVQRVVLGTREVVRRLTQGLGEVLCGVTVQTVAPAASGVEVRWDGGGRTFDHVVVASQANQARRLLAPAFTAERDALAGFAYEASEVVVHTDPALAPRQRANWAPVNILVDDAQPRPMATIWLNRVQRDLRALSPVFQTWNPLLAPEESRVLARARFERPVVDAASVGASAEVTRLHSQPHRRLWLCGSYLGPGVPLLEAAASSSERVANAIGDHPAGP